MSGSQAGRRAGRQEDMREVRRTDRHAGMAADAYASINTQMDKEGVARVNVTVCPHERSGKVVYLLRTSML